MVSLRWTIWLALVVVPGIAAQSLPEQDEYLPYEALPECALSCMPIIVNQTACDVQDMPCLCADRRLMEAAELCALSRCTVRESLYARNLTARACEEPIRDRSYEFSVIVSTIAILSALFVVQRFAFKVYADITLAVDDWLTLITEIACVPATVIQIYGLVPNGVGLDFWTLTSDQRTTFFKNLYALQLLYLLHVSLLKLALLSFFVRMFIGKRIRWVLIGTIVFTSLYGIVFVTVAALQCSPVGFFWEQWDLQHEGHCMNSNAIAWIHAAISITLDIWMLAIPLWELKRLNLDWKKKAGVALMFIVGTFVTVISIARLQHIVTFGIVSINPTWDNFDLVVWSALEIHVGIICACLPSLRLMLVHFYPDVLGSIQNRSQSLTNSWRRSATLKRTLQMQGPTVHIGRGSQPTSPVQGNAIKRELTVIVEYDEESRLMRQGHRNAPSVDSTRGEHRNSHSLDSNVSSSTVIMEPIRIYRDRNAF
ncbi:hypothetical protein S40288_09088 [Stachybotrys chartarum IBT 40288]|nr:hypothetical protein S40288_09088 [Stachybotrys chartarum IBT 40288]